MSRVKPPTADEIAVDQELLGNVDPDVLPSVGRAQAKLLKLAERSMITLERMLDGREKVPPATRLAAARTVLEAVGIIGAKKLHPGQGKPALPETAEAARLQIVKTLAAVPHGERHALVREADEFAEDDPGEDELLATRLPDEADAAAPADEAEEEVEAPAV